MVVRSNRTFMELKLLPEPFRVRYNQRSNRTFMELKCEKWKISIRQ